MKLVNANGQHDELTMTVLHWVRISNKKLENILEKAEVVTSGVLRKLAQDASWYGTVPSLQPSCLGPERDASCILTQYIYDVLDDLITFLSRLYAMPPKTPSTGKGAKGVSTDETKLCLPSRLAPKNSSGSYLDLGCLHCNFFCKFSLVLIPPPVLDLFKKTCNILNLIFVSTPQYQVQPWPELE